MTIGWAIHADLWKSIFDIVDDIGIELVTVRKVGAHRRVETARSPRDLADNQGNGHADVGAKAGVTLHPSDPPLLVEIKKKKREVINVCKFITQIEASSEEVAIRSNTHTSSQSKCSISISSQSKCSISYRL